MTSLFMTLLPFLVFLGLILVLGLALAALFWPSMEWWLLCWLQRRRRERENRYQPRTRLAAWRH